MRIALVQLTSTPDIEQNLDVCRRLSAAAADGGAEWVLFPENAPFLGRDVDKRNVQEGDDGPMVGAYREMAREHGLWVTIGSYPERIDDVEGDDRTYNTLLMLNPDGEIAAKYRKIHMFDVEIEGGISYIESEGVAPGDDVKTCTVPVDGRDCVVGLSVCYDLRFPEMYRALLERGSEVLIVPSAFTLQTGRDHWHALLRARAIENQCWVLAPAQFGHHFGKRWSYGHTVAYDPWGHQVAMASERVGNTFVELDLSIVDDVRRKMPCGDHRRL